MKLKDLCNDSIYLYIVLNQFENTFNSYNITEVIGFTGMGKEEILKHLEVLNNRGIIQKDNLKMNYRTGVEIL